MNPLLLTGGTGYLGRRVNRRLADAGYPTWTLTRGTPQGFAGQGEQWNPRRPQDLQVWAHDPRTVVHMAGIAHQHHHAPSRAEYLRGNAILTRRLAEAAKAQGVEHFILVSSVAVYGPGCCEADERQPRRPVGDYGWSKVLAEDAVERLAEAQFAVTVIRLGTLFGGADDPGNVGRLARQIQHPWLPHLTTAGNRKCLLWVDDAAAALARVAAAKPPAAYNVFNLAGSSLAMQQVVRTLRHGSRLPKLSPPVPSGLLLQASRWARPLPVVGRRAARLAATLEKWRGEDTFSSAAFERQFGPVATAPVTERLASIGATVRTANLHRQLQPST